MFKKLTLIVAILFVAFSLSACDILSPTGESDGLIRGSGYIAARTVSVAPELGGKVREMLVEEGDSVRAGDPLFRLDDEIVRAQSDQAAAAVTLAESALATANTQLESADIQYQMALQGARFQDQAIRQSSWLAAQPEAFALPGWYYEKDEEVAAAQAEVDAAWADLVTEQANLQAELTNASNADLVAAETRLAEARTAYLNAEQTLAQAQAAQDGEKLADFAQEQLDAAQSELDSAQLEYDRILSTAAYDDVLDARARAAVARTRYDNALDALDRLQTGERSLGVEAALAAVRTAESGVTQAEAGLAQANAALRLLEVQLEKTEILAPVTGVVLARNLEAGEVVGAGSVGIVLGELDEVELTVYIPEDRYGQVQLGQSVAVTVDSFAGKTFTGAVVRIADEAEFTPRNVQTVDGRKSTVYAVVIRLPNPDWNLKPGMPADAVIDAAP